MVLIVLLKDGNQVDQNVKCRGSFVITMGLVVFALSDL